MSGATSIQLHPVLQRYLKKPMCQHNKDEQQAAVGSQGPYKTDQGQEVLETNNIYILKCRSKW